MGAQCIVSNKDGEKKDSRTMMQRSVKLSDLTFRYYIFRTIELYTHILLIDLSNIILRNSKIKAELPLEGIFSHSIFFPRNFYYKKSWKSKITKYTTFKTDKVHVF